MSDSNTSLLVQTQKIGSHNVFTSETGRKAGQTMTPKRLLSLQLTGYSNKKCGSCELPCPYKITNLLKDKKHKCILSPMQVHWLTMANDPEKVIKESVMADITLLDMLAKTYNEKLKLAQLKLELKREFYPYKEKNDSGALEVLDQVLRKVIKEKATYIDVTPQEASLDNSNASHSEATISSPSEVRGSVGDGVIPNGYGDIAPPISSNAEHSSANMDASHSTAVPMSVEEEKKEEIDKE